MISMKSKIFEFIKRAPYFEKWVMLGALVGVFVGIMISLFNYLIEVVAYSFSYLVDGPHLFTSDFAIIAMYSKNKILIPLSLVLGSLISGVLVYRFSKEAEGPGIDPTIAAYHFRCAIVDEKLPLIKMIASAFTLASGGSGGVQGPSVQIGAGLGYIIHKTLKLNHKDRRILFISGISAALSSIFRSPIGAAIYSIEVFYQRDFEVKALVPSIISSVFAYIVTIPIFGVKPLLPPLKISISEILAPGSFLAYALLGLFIAPFGILFTITFKRFQKTFDHIKDKTKIPEYFKPVIGAALLGILGVFFPYVLGQGREILVEIAEGTFFVNHQEVSLIMFLLFVALLKMVATSLSIGSGGSGGIFGPSIFIGFVLGYLFGVLIGKNVSPLDPIIFAYIGTSAFFGAISKSPLGSSIIVSEMAESYFLVLPTLFASIISRELTRGPLMYSYQLPSRIRPDVQTLYSICLLEDPSYKEFLKRPIKEFIEKGYVASVFSKVKDVIHHIFAQELLPVVSEDGKVLGIVKAETILSCLELLERPIKDVMTPDIPAISPNENIKNFAEKIMIENSPLLVVIDSSGKYLGIVRCKKVLEIFITKTKSNF